MTKRWGESGNIFFTLFGAVALVGVVGAATSTLMRGPVGTVVALNQRAKADSQMQIAMKLAMLEAQQRDTSVGDPAPDCDGDGLIEPTAPGVALPGLVGGGQLPSVGSTTNDPWGKPYGYCGWDHGSIGGPTIGSACADGSGQPLLDGVPGAGGVVIAVISAGPDREFGVTCNNAPASSDAYFTRGVNGADDIIVDMTYAEANEASGGLWYLKSGDPDMITTGKELDVQQGAQFSSGDVSFQTDTSFGGTVDLRNNVSNPNAGWFFLPDETGLLDADCNIATRNANAGAMRRQTGGGVGGQVLQICDPFDSDPATDEYWADIGGAGAIVAAAGNDGEIQFNAGGIMAADPGLRFNSGGGLSADGDSVFGADVDVAGDLNVDDNLTVGINTILTGTLNVGGAVDFNSTIDVAGDATFGGWLRGANGSAAAPTFSFTGDTDTGIYYSSGGLGFSAGGSTGMTVTSSGFDAPNGNIAGDLVVGDELTTNSLIVNDNITADRFISRMATTSAALPGFETEPGTGMFSSVDNTLSLVTGGSTRFIIDGTGDVGIGVASPDATLDVGGEIKVGTSAVPCGATIYGAIRYVSGDLLQVCSSMTNDWEDIGTSGGGGGGAASYWTRISVADPRLYYTADFVGVGTNDPLADFHVNGDFLVTGVWSGTASAPVAGAGTRMFFDPESGSFRAGSVDAAQWDDANIGDYSFVFGRNVQANGDYARALGQDIISSGYSSMVIGQNAQATNTGSVALGYGVTSSGVNSVIWGLGVATGALPIVSGNESHVTIMGDQSGVNVTANNTWALLGGRMLIDQTPAANPAVSGTLSVDVEGGVGAVQYCDENGLNCFTAESVATGGVGAPGTNREVVFNSNGVLGTDPRFTFSSAGNLTLGGTGAIALPVGDGTNRPAVPANGMIRYNSTTGKFEGYQGGGWYDIITTGGGGIAIDDLSDAETDYTGDFNMWLGVGAGAAIQATGQYNIGIGQTTADAVTTGDNNNALGYGALGALTTGSSNNAVGYLALGNNNGSYNQAFGHLALRGQAGSTGGNNVAVGSQAIYSLTGGNNNVAVGHGSLYANDSGNGNSVLGALAGDSITSGSFNIAIGYDADVPSPTGSYQLNIGNLITGTTNAGLVTINGTGALTLPIGQTGNRPASPVNGMLRYNSISGKFEGYQGGAWQDILTSAVAGGAAAPNRGIQFNSGGSFTADANFLFTSGGSFVTNGTYTGVADTSLPSGASSRMFYDPARGAFRAGRATGTHWDSANIGNYSFAGGFDVRAGGTSAVSLGSNLNASSIYGVALGNRVNVGNGVIGSGQGDGSMAIGLIDDAVLISTIPQVRGVQSLGIFMGDQDGLAMTANSTMGLFGGQFVIDPNVPATQLSARATLDLGASTDAILLPIGQTANRPASPVNGMLRYNSVSGKFEGYQGGAWQDILTSAVAGGAAAPDRGIQFNSGGNFAASSSLVYTSTGMLSITGPTDGAGNTVLNIQDDRESTINIRAGVNTEGGGFNFQDSSGNNQYQMYMYNGTGDFRIGSNQSGGLPFTFDTNITRLYLIDPRIRVGIATNNPQSSFDIATNDALAMPRGTTAQRPGTPVNGMLRYNSQTGKFEGYQGGAWQDILTSGGGVIAINDLTDAIADYGSDHNIFFASGSGANIAAGGQYNFGAGEGALNSVTTGDGNLGIGYNAVSDVTNGSWNIGIGYRALEQVVNSDNIAIGSDALRNITTQDRNTAIGQNALDGSATGDDNIAMGYYAGSANANGDRNVLIGNYVQESGTNNSESVFIGHEAGRNIGFGGANVAVGFGSLRAVSNGNANEANTAIGYETLDSITTGNNNIALGFQAGDNLTSGSNNIIIGYTADAPSATGSNQLVIGDLITGTTNAGLLTINGTGALTLPVGQTATRPASPVNGMLRYNSVSGKFEGYQGGAWQDILTSAVAGGAAAPDRGIQFNSGGSFAADANLTYTSQGALVVSGTYIGTVTEPVSGAGTRMFFDPRKSAFRAGTVTSSQWNYTSTGNYSTATGYNTVASGLYSTAMGSSATASGNMSTAIGNSTTASGNTSIAMGSGATASGDYSLATNFGSTASGNSSTALGRNSTASGAYSTATGFAATASGQSSTAMGQSTTASGLYGIAMGRSVITGDGTAASGFGDGSMALGLIDDAVAITTRSQVRGIQSMGIFMGDQDGLVMTANNTMGLFGGQFVMDPRVPAQQLSARADMDLGASTDAILLPIGQVSNRPASPVNGMLRYNSVSGKFEGYQGGAWQDILTSAVAGGAAAPDRGIQFNSGGSFAADSNFVYLSTGRLGIGTPTPTSELHVIKTNTATSGTSNLSNFTVDVTPGAVSTATNNGIRADVRANSGTVSNYGTLRGIDSIAQLYTGIGSGASLVQGARIGAYTGGGTVNSLEGLDITAMNSGSGGNTAAVTNLKGIDILVETDNPATVTNSYGIDIYQSTSGGVITNRYGVHIDADNSGTVTNDFGLYQAADIQKNFFAGDVGIGTEDPAAALDVATTDAIVVARGNTAQRPASPVNGMLRYNSQTGRFEGYQGGAWQDILTSGGGAIAINDLTDAITNYTSGNMYLGQGNGDNTTTGIDNTAVGNNALGVVTTGRYNTAVGSYALTQNIVGDFNTALGYAALQNNTDGYNTAVGYRALRSNTSGNSNTAMGYMALDNATSSSNVALGYLALNGVTTGIGNTAIGTNAGNNSVAITTGSYNTFIGLDTGSNGNAYSNSAAIGNGALITASNQMVFGNANVAYIDLGNGGIVNARINGTGAVTVPRGNTAQRPAGVDGMLRYNSQTGRFEGYQAGSWQDILTSSIAGGAAAPDRGVQFNSGGSFAASADFSYTSAGVLFVQGVHNNVSNVPVSGAGTRMFFDPNKDSFRVGTVTGTEWDNASIGQHSIALGYDTVASGWSTTAIGSATMATGSNSSAFGFAAHATGDRSLALGNMATASGYYSIVLGRSVATGNYTPGSGLGDGSIAIGLVDEAVTVTDAPQIHGIQSMGIFMGDQESLIMTANNTMGLFGGQMVIDPRVPAQQLSARSVLDLGAATDSVVMPAGTTAQRPGTPVNGMLRYNSQTSKFEGYQAGAWQDILTSGGGTTSIDDLSDAITNYTSSNMYLGQNVGAATSSGTANTALGSASLPSLTTGTNNTAYGQLTLNSLTTGSNNVALGAAAGAGLTTNSSRNIAIGFTALYGSSNRSDNVAIGHQVLTTAGVGSLNVGIGTNVLNTNAGKSESTAIGYEAMRYADSAAGAAISYNTALGAYALRGSTTATNNIGIYNTAIGHSALLNDTSGWANTGIGAGAMQQNTTGSRNTASGYYALRQNTSGLGNVATGSESLTTNTTGYDNVSVGKETLYYNTTGDSNTAIGANALRNNVGKTNSTAIGTGAMYWADSTTANTNTYNTAVGAYALRGSTTAANNTGIRNTAIGHSAMLGTTTGSSNTALGAETLTNITTGSSNTALGETALLLLQGGTRNTAVGNGAMQGAVSVEDSTAVGRHALRGATGWYNTALGTGAAEDLAGGSYNIAIGYNAELFSSSGNYQLNIGDAITGTMNDGNIAVNGTAALTVPRGTTAQRPGSAVNGMLRYNSQTGKFEGYQAGAWQDILTSGGGTTSIDDLSDAETDYTTNFNMFMGSGAGAAIAANGLYNLAIGQGAGASITTGDTNIAIGYQALPATVTSGANIAMGYRAGYMLNGGQTNLAIGNNALYYNVFYDDNTAIGNDSQYRMEGGGDNTSLGRSALYGNPGATAGNTGDANVALGAQSLMNISSGNRNIGIGYQAGTNLTTGSDNILIGTTINFASATGSFQLNIGDLITGTTNAGLMQVNGTGALTLPIGQTATRPSSPVNGMIRYNSQTSKFEGYQAGAWQDILTSGVTGGAAGANTEIQFNSGGSFGAHGGLRYDMATQKLFIGGDGTSGLYTSSATALSIGTNNTARIVIPYGGGVSVIDNLSVAGAADTRISLNSGGSAAVWLINTNYGAAGAQVDDLVIGRTAGSGDIVFSSANIGINTFAPAAALDINTTDAIVMPRGTTAQRPASPVNGMIRYNNQTGKFEGYQAGVWTDIITAGGTAASPDRGIQFNSGGSFTASSNLQYTSTGVLLASGTFTGSGTQPASGAGTRIFFDPNMSAFRAGTVSAGQWNYTSVGNYSTAFGYNTIASGTYSTAMGYSTQATYDYTTALGFGSIANNTSSTAIGNNATAGGRYSVAMGASTTTSGDAAIAMGSGTSASGDYATAMGDFTIASGQNSMAFGRRVTAGNGTPYSGFGDGSMALGLIDDGVAITTRSQVRGTQSLGIFMGDQDGLVMTANNTMGLFGGRFVMDPRVPAQQLSARADMDLGASTDALLLPIGQTSNRPASPVNGMIRYNSQTGKFEGYQAGVWTDIITAGGTAASPVNGIQFNSGGAFAASSKFTWLDSTGTLQFTSGGSLTSSTISTSTPELVLEQTGDFYGAVRLRLQNRSGLNGALFENPALDLVDFGFRTSTSKELNVRVEGRAGLSYTMPGNDPNGEFQIIDPNGGSTIFYARVGAAESVLYSPKITMDGTGSLKVPSGTTAQRPSSPVNGMLRYNSQTGKFEGYQAGVWTDIITAGGTAAAPNNAVQFNSGGSFAGSAGFLYDDTSGLRVGVGAAPTYYDAMLTLFDVASSAQLRWGPTHVDSSTMAGYLGYDGSSERIEITGANANVVLGRAYETDVFVDKDNGFVAIGGAGDPQALLDIQGTDAILLPRGQVSNRPASPVNGMLRYNSVSGKFEGYQAGAWADILTGAASVTFLSLTDTPSSYAGAGGQYLRVNSGATAVEFTDQIVPSVSGQPAPTNTILDDLGDVAVSGPTAGQILTYSGGQWINGTATGGAATAGGANTQVQFNSGGSLAGSALMTYQSSALTLGTSTAGETNVLNLYQTNGGGNAASIGFYNNTSTLVGEIRGWDSSIDLVAVGDTRDISIVKQGTSSNTVLSNLYLSRYNNSGAGANGIGSSIISSLESATDGTYRTASEIQTVATNASAVNFATRMTMIPRYNNAATTGMTLLGSSGGTFVGINNTAPAVGLDVLTTDAMIMPRGTTAQRPGTPVNGMLRYNSQTGKFEGYQAGAWTDIITAGGTAASPDRGIQFNSGNAFTASSNLQYTSTGSLLLHAPVDNGIAPIVVTNTADLPVFYMDINWDYPRMFMFDTGNIERHLINSWYNAGPYHGIHGENKGSNDYHGANLALTLGNGAGNENGIFMGDNGNADWGSPAATAIVYYDTNAIGYGYGGLRLKTNNGSGLTTRMQIDQDGIVSFTSSGAMLLNVGTTAQRPSSPVNGMLRYNSQTGKFEGYQAGSWQDIATGAAGGSASAPDRGIQFNSGGSFAASANLVYTSAGRLGLGTGAPTNTIGISGDAANTIAMENRTTAGDGYDLTIRAGGRGTGNDRYGGYLYLDAGQASGTGSAGIAMRVPGGWVGSGSADRPYEVALELDGSTGSGYFGHGNNVSGSSGTSYAFGFANRVTGWHALGVGNSLNVYGAGAMGFSGMYTNNGSGDAANPTISGDDSIAFFLNDQTNVDVATTGTFNILGSSVFINPDTTSAAVIAPRGVIDVGYATDAIVMPRGTTAQRPGTPVNGMIRYNSQTNKFEGYQGGAWADIVTGAATASFLSLTDTPASYAGNGGMFVKVNSGETALEFTNNLVNTVSGAPAPTGMGIDDLGDVTITAATAGQILTYSGGQWINGTSSGGGSIDGLSDGITDYSTDFNLYMGQNAGINPTAGAQYNLAIGQNAFDAASKTNAADYNVAIGYDAMTANTSGTQNVAIGTGAMDSNTSGSYNVGVGRNALQSNTSGSYNYALGTNAMNASTTANSDVAIGNFALGNTTTGDDNIAIGSSAMQENTVREQSVAIGHQAMMYAYSGGAADEISYNTAIGYRALRGSTTAASNTGRWNTAVGHSALIGATSGSDNTAIGYAALDEVTTGNYNVGVGNSTLTGVSTAGYNTAVGWSALALATGGNNTALGYAAGDAITTGTGNIIIGYDNDAPSATGSNQLDIGDTIYGDLSTDRIGIGAMPATGVELDVTGDVQYTGTLTDVSDMRLKDNIVALSERGSMLDKLDQIGTYSFTMKDDKDGQVEFGVMAQEINKVFPELVKVDESTADKYMSVNYVGLIAPLVEASKELKAENEDLKAKLSTIEERMASLEGDMNGMKAHTGYGISKAQMGLGMMIGMMLMGGFAGTFLLISRRRKQG